MMKDLSKNLLIFGAGAHVPYGYPTAIGLRELFYELSNFLKNGFSSTDGYIKKTSETEDLWVIFRAYINTPAGKKDPNLHTTKFTKDTIETIPVWFFEDLKMFINNFLRSRVKSIDTFLTRKTISLHEQTLGKVLIIHLLRKKEESSCIRIKYDWIEYLINNLLQTREELDFFFENPPKIYTFNYDLLLERTLFDNLVLYHEFSETDAVAKITNLKIKHVYGEFYSHNYQIKEKDQDRYDFIVNSIEEIKFIGENNTTHNDINTDIGNVNNILFLGFGFEKNNLKILFKNFDEPNKGLQKKNFFSTNIGLDHNEITLIKENLPPDMNINFFEDEFELGKKDCFRLIRENLKLMK